MRAPIIAAAIAAALAVAPAGSALAAAPAPPSRPVVLAATAAPTRWYAVDSSPVSGAYFVQSTISVPPSIAWTAPGETASAWVMLSTGTCGMRAGWRWTEGSAPTLIVDTWAGTGYVTDPVRPSSPDAQPPAQLPVQLPVQPPVQLPVPTPGSTISVGVYLLSGGSGGSSRWFVPVATTPADDGWPMAAPMVRTTAGVSVTDVIRAAEVTAPPGTPEPAEAQPVVFSGGLVGASDGAIATPPPVTLVGGQRTTAGPASPSALDSMGVKTPLVPKSPWETTSTTTMTHSFGASSFGGYTPGQPALVWEQSTISVPTTMHWTAPSGEAASAWVMATASQSQWDQIGWTWSQGAPAPQLFGETGQSPAHPALNYPIQYGQTLTPGSSITVAVGCNPGTHTYTNWVWEAGSWVLMSAVNANQPCGDWGLSWTRALENVSAVGTPQPTPAQPVRFAGTLAESAAGDPISLPPFVAARGTYSVNE